MFGQRTFLALQARLIRIAGLSANLLGFIPMPNPKPKSLQSRLVLAALQRPVHLAFSFFQHLPVGCKWDWGLSWGHAVSEDLVTWTNLEPALTTTHGMQQPIIN